MAWEMLKATGKLVKNLISLEVENVITEISYMDSIQRRTNRKVAESLKPHLRKIEPEHQSWYRMRLGMSEEQVGKFLGLPDAINIPDSVTTDPVIRKHCGPCWDEAWHYSSKSLFEYNLDGVVRFEKKKVTYFRLYHKKGKRWQAREVPPIDWLKAKQEEVDSGELGTIL